MHCYNPHLNPLMLNKEFLKKFSNGSMILEIIILKLRMILQNVCNEAQIIGVFSAFPNPNQHKTHIFGKNVPKYSFTYPVLEITNISPHRLYIEGALPIILHLVRIILECPAPFNFELCYLLYFFPTITGNKQSFLGLNESILN